MLAKSLQTLLAAIGIVVTGFLLFADGFIGTPNDFAKAFLWAFGIDVGLNAFIETVKQLKT